MTIEASEGEELKMNMDINARLVDSITDLYQDASLAVNYVSRANQDSNENLFNWNAGSNYGSPFFFSQGTFTAFGEQFLKVNSVSITINNNLLYKEDPNINFKEVDKKKVLDYVNNFKFEETLKKEFNLLNDFITSPKNYEQLKEFSVVVKQKKSKSKRDFKVQDTIVNTVKRSFSEEGNQYIIGSILDSDKDNTFDIISEDNIDKYKEPGANKTKLRRLYRDESRIPLMIIFLVSGEESVPEPKSPLSSSVIPILYFFLPAIGDKKLVISKNNIYK